MTANGSWVEQGWSYSSSRRLTSPQAGCREFKSRLPLHTHRPRPCLVFPNFNAHANGPYDRPMFTNLSEAISAYRVIATADGKSPKTIEWVTGSVRLFQRFVDRGPDLSSLTRNNLRKFILDLQ